MADKTFIPTTGAQTWINTANWNGGTIPVTGDRVFINSGDATLIITAGSTQAAVLLAECIGLDTFLGQFDVDVAATIWRIGFPSGSTNANNGCQKWVITNAGNATTVLAYKCGASVDATSGLSTIRFHGTHATANAIYVFPGVTTMEIGTSLAASVVTTLDVQGGGSIIVRQNATTKFNNITGGTFTHTGLCAASGTLVVTNGTVTTTGDTKFPAITVNGGTVNLAHRASSGDSATTVIQNGGVLSLQGDPRAFAVTTSFAFNGGTLQHFGLSQITGVTLTVPPGKLTTAA